MKLKRCAVLQVALEDEARFDIAGLLAGGDGLVRTPRWMASAPHLPAAREVTLAELAVLEQIPTDREIEQDELIATHGELVIDALRDAGWLLSDDLPESPRHRLDRSARDVAWWAPALLAQVAGTWTGVDIEARQEAGQMPASAELVAANGPAPAHEHLRRPGLPAKPLPAPPRRQFDELLAQRRTCRNFDPEAEVSAGALGSMLYRVWGAVGTRELAPGAVAVKKSSPAGGGLHAVEAYLLVQRAEGLEPGLYHYLPIQHALEPMQTLTPADARALAHRMLAGQHWFVDTPVLVVMTARFDRLFWKYQRHAKAWRVLHLDAGHLSQTMYLSAADLGLGAFVTAAINDGDIGSALELESLREGALAMVGFGPRSPDPRNIELDDLVPTPAALRAGA